LEVRVEMEMTVSVAVEEEAEVEVEVEVGGGWAGRQPAIGEHELCRCFAGPASSSL